MKRCGGKAWLAALPAGLAGNAALALGSSAAGTAPHAGAPRLAGWPL
jgi:hypothetical protein